MCRVVSGLSARKRQPRKFAEDQVRGCLDRAPHQVRTPRPPARPARKPRPRALACTAARAARRCAASALLDHTAVAHATRPSLPTSARPRGRDLRSTRMHNPDGVGLIRPIHSEVIAHSVSSFGHPPERPCSRNGEVGLIPALRRGHFLLNLRRRSLADRDTLPLSLRRLGVERSSGRQAPPSRGAALDLFYSLLFPCL
jgi:hypothetical protein